MLDRALFPPHIVITAQDLQNTPPAVLNLLEYLLRENMALRRQVEDLTKQVAKQSKQIEELTSRLNLNSSNSSRPPSSDSPYKSKEAGNAPPIEKEWETFYGRLMKLIARYRDNKDATGTFARRLEREIAHLWVFLEQEGVSPTNNHAERMIRFGVLWRKCSQGTSSDKGNRWVERILSLRQTCRLRASAGGRLGKKPGKKEGGSISTRSARAHDRLGSPVAHCAARTHAAAQPDRHHGNLYNPRHGRG